MKFGSATTTWRMPTPRPTHTGDNSQSMWWEWSSYLLGKSLCTTHKIADGVNELSSRAELSLDSWDLDSTGESGTFLWCQFRRPVRSQQIAFDTFLFNKQENLIFLTFLNEENKQWFVKYQTWNYWNNQDLLFLLPKHFQRFQIVPQSPTLLIWPQAWNFCRPDSIWELDLSLQLFQFFFTGMKNQSRL